MTTSATTPHDDTQQETITIELAYALPDEQTLLRFTVPKNSNIRRGIEQSAILQQYPELQTQWDNDRLVVGIFGKKARLDQRLREKDRIEIYRPLIADPKEVRKRKAAEGKKLKKGGSPS